MSLEKVGEKLFVGFWVRGIGERKIMIEFFFFLEVKLC